MMPFEVGWGGGVKIPLTFGSGGEKDKDKDIELYIAKKNYEK